MILGPPDFGQRVDRAVLAALHAAGISCTRSALARSFAAGLVTADGRRLKPGRVVDRETKVAVELVPAAPLRAEPEDIPLRVVHEDEDLLVVDKPANMVVHPGPGHPTGTLVAAVLHHLGVSAAELPTLPGNDETRPGIVHRLDRDTSGLLVVAKHAQAQELLAKQFREHSIDRSYWGLVAGVPSFSTTRVQTGHGRDPADRRRFAPHGTRQAITEVEVVRRLTDAAELRFTLQTGRTHQIRMHAAHLGHPIVGDEVYGVRARDLGRRAQIEALRRHALHAETLGFEHPRGGRRRFESPLPAALRELADAWA